MRSALYRTFAMLVAAIMLLVLFPTQPGLAQASPIGTGVCTASSLNVRTGPSTSYSRLGSIPRGTRVTVYQQRNGWYQIAYGSGYGWCSGKYIDYSTSTQPPATTPSGAIGTGVVTTSGGHLNVRSGPSTGYAKIGSLANRTSVVIYESKSGWYRIIYSGKTAWVYGAYIRFTPATADPSSTPTPPSTPKPSPTGQTPTPTPTPSPSSAGIGTGKVSVSGSLNVRSGPGTSYSRIGKVYNGNVLTVYSVRSGWVEVDYKGRHCWVYDKYIRVTYHSEDDGGDDPGDPPSDTSDEVIGTGVVNVSTSLNVRSGPGTSYAKVGSLSRGVTVNILADTNSWYKIERNGLVGWCSAPYIVANLSSQPDSIVQSVENYTYEQMMEDIRALKARYPDSITVSSIGTSVQGRDVPVLIVGDSDADIQILIHANIHGREHMNGNLVMMQIEYMLANPNSKYNGRTFSQWMQNAAFHIIPMVNPDGVTISQTKSGSDDVLAICALNLIGSSELPGYLSRWKANANGVDLNLQFPSGWEEKDSVDQPAGVEFKGTTPLSEPEAMALKSYTQSHPFDVTISYHSTGSVIYINFPLASYETNAKCQSLGQAVRGLSGYTIRDTPLTEGAGYKDWALSELGIASLTIETGTTSCPLPLSQFAGIWEKNKYLWPVLIQWAEDNTD